jgi:hypothetical protein
MSQVLLWGSIMLFIANDDETTENEKLTEEHLYSLGKSISTIWLFSVVLFFMTCKKEFIGTFVGTATQRTYVKASWDWQNSQEPGKVADEVIVNIFRKHFDSYRAFEPAVSAFVSANWERWNLEKPKFFTNKFVQSIPLSVLSEEIRAEVMMGRGINNDESGVEMGGEID